MKKYALIGILPVLFVLISIASAIGPEDVSLTTPTDATWTNLDNYTTGFVFQWADSDDSSYTTANCTLHLTDTNFLPVLTNGSYFHTYETATESTATTLYQNAAVTNTTKTYYWTVECYNTSSLDGLSAGWSPTANILYVDDSTPQYIVDSLSFTNGTWVTNANIWIAVNGTDTSAIVGTYTASIVNTTGTIKASGTGTGITDLINITYTAPEGENIIGIKLCDPASNCNATSDNYTVSVDTVIPTATVITPTVGSTAGVDYILANFTIVETNNDTVIFDLEGTNYTLPSTNCTDYTTHMHCIYNFTGLSNTRNMWIIAYANDSAGQWGASVNVTFNVDTASTAVTTKYNWTITDSIVSYKILATDVTPTLCEAIIWNSTSDAIATKTGSWTRAAATSNCSGTFSGTDISDDGAFIVEYNVTDGNGNAASSNLSGVITTLYTGWNVVTWLGANDTVDDICDTVEYCTQVSKFGNSGKSFTTYSIATPTVHNTTYIDHGDAVLIYVTASDYLFQNDHTDTFQAGLENASLYTGGWNIMGLFSATTLNTTLWAQTYNGTYIDNTTLRNITYSSWLNTNADLFYSCLRDSEYCVPFSLDLAAVNITIPKGYAVLNIVDANITTNRTRIVS